MTLIFLYRPGSWVSPSGQRSAAPSSTSGGELALEPEGVALPVFDDRILGATTGRRRARSVAQKGRQCSPCLFRRARPTATSGPPCTSGSGRCNASASAVGAVRLAVLNLTRENTDRELGELVCVAGALLTFRSARHRHLQAPTDALRVLRCL